MNVFPDICELKELTTQSTSLSNIMSVINHKLKDGWVLVDIARTPLRIHSSYNDEIHTVVTLGKLRNKGIKI